MKKRIKYVFIMLICIVLIPKVEALSVAKNTVTVDAGSTVNVEVYANVGEKEVNKIVFNMEYTSDDNTNTNFYAINKYTDTESNNTGHTIYHTVSLDEAKSGQIYLGNARIKTVNNPNGETGQIKFSAASAITTDGEVITLNNPSITVNINKTNNDETTTTTTTTTSRTTEKPTTTTTKKVNNEATDSLLQEITSNIVKIELKNNVYEYTVKVVNTTEELDLVPIAKDENTKIDITTQKISELENNKIIITLKNNDKEEKYTINIKLVEPKTTQTVVIDNNKFVETNSYRGKWVAVIIVLCALVIPTLLFLRKK